MKRLVFAVAGLAILGNVGTARLVNAGTITITAEDAGSSMLRVGYEVTGGVELPIGFGLDIVLSEPAIFTDLVSASPHFPIYPGNFGRYITVDPVTGGVVKWDVPGYNPVASPYDPGALGGLGTSSATIEMAQYGSSAVMGEPGFNGMSDFTADGRIDDRDLAVFVDYWLASILLSPPPADLNRDGWVDFMDYAMFVEGRYGMTPPSMPELILLQLDGNGASTTMVTISENWIRAGIVDEQGMYFDVILPEPFIMVVPEPATLLFLGLGGLMLRKRGHEVF